MAEVTLEIPVATGESENCMADGSVAVADGTVMSVVLTGMASAAASQADNRTKRADQLSADAAAMWGIHMTTPTIFAGMGFRVAQQSAGWPADKGTGTGGA